MKYYSASLSSIGTLASTCMGGTYPIIVIILIIHFLSIETIHAHWRKLGKRGKE